ncbi:hypothetical protein GTP81_10155 [Rugamonas sp. FT107W]|uniref:Toxin VasX N-terminal region domain-containing protein n=1 Tax=Duganella vulcania TaxID=2692166 RepID=A0A845HI77_9BURK|nr:T6SS effector BTH_I2691 family protein [Duganella vulcania]MYN17113.1 hypothetical protein [Duganella vulcania]
MLEGCQFCDRSGVLIYPVRYAVACPAGAADTPGLSGNFQIENAPTDIAAAKYTLRAIRTGYLYTYDGKSERLKAYVVLPTGYLWNFSCEGPAPTTHPSAPGETVAFKCTQKLDAALSRCVDVRYSKDQPAGEFWIGWSNSIWTAGTIRKARDREWRLKHMRCIDIPWTRTGLRDRHVGEFHANYKKISHFSMSEKEMKKAFGFSNTPIDHETGRNPNDLIDAFKKVGALETGYIVAIDDPVGIANDLSELTVPNEHSGFDVELYRGRIVEEILQFTESALREQSRKDFDFQVEQKKIDDQNPNIEGVSYSDMRQLWEAAKAGGPGNLAKRKREEERKYGVDIGAQRKAAEDREWAELTVSNGKSVLDAKKRADFPALYNAAVKNFEKNGLALAQAHADWLGSEQLYRWMDGVHDEEDICSGFAYRESLGQCVGKAAATSACDKRLSDWLKSGDASNVRNLYARAMLFNQTEIINAANPQIKGGDIKLKNILNIYKQSLGRLKKGQELRLVDRLIFTTTNSILKALGQNANKAMQNIVLISLSLLGKTAISASNHSAHDIRNWIISEAKNRGIKFDDGKAEAKSAALKIAKKIPDAKPLTPGICAYELDFAQLEEDGRIAPGVVKGIKIPGYQLTEKWLGSSTDFNIGSVAVVLQLSAFIFAFRDFRDSDQFESNKKLIKLGAAVLSLSGAILELTGSVMEKSPTHPLSVAIYDHWAKGPALGKKIYAFGKKLGLAAGLLTAIFDIHDAYKSHLENDSLLESLYIGSAVLGASLAIASYLSAAAFWPLFIAAIVLAIVIAMLKKAALAKWLSHCFFSLGYQENSGYQTLEDELRALQSALGD